MNNSAEKAVLSGKETKAKGSTIKGRAPENELVCRGKKGQGGRLTLEYTKRYTPNLILAKETWCS